ncbi:glycosyltransferase [Porticoccaceae bacterium]|nr:glycosyltransferase [Porticoccaceae bacterium]
MKVSIITSFPFPDGKATANRIMVFAEELIKSTKIDYVEIFCSSNGPSRSYLLNDALRVTSIKFNVINKNRLVIRAIYELSLAFRLFRVARQSKFDLTIVTVPSILLLVPIILNLKRNFIALDLRDAIWTYFNVGFFSRIVGKLIARLFSVAARNSQIISVTNVSECQAVKEITGRSPLVVANGISQAKLDNMQSLRPPMQCDHITLAYIGNVGIAQNLEQLIDYSKKIPDLQIKIIGDGARLEDLKQKSVTEDLKNVFFTGFVNPCEIGKHIETADILFAQIGSDYRTAIPTKVFEYIASGRKVLLGLPNGPAKKIFSKFNGVVIFDVGVRESFLKSYDRLKNLHYSDLDRKKDIAHLSENYLRESSAKSFVRAIERL